ncbi:hypothetical protein DEW08_26095 (plasmid) [Azospirillum thermophilum]|uniref:Polysaccharide biosynthesis protein n=2 Tax=Azospirillum thermophilum TaxID=2202148 RepID=A0A2S2CYD6_9PROT|nr:hypothetical protein DEW08_26095 [Azospirillum thermophilum]
MSVGAKVMRQLPALFGAQMMQYLVTLLTIPLLARTLGPEGWGRTALLMTFAQLALIPLEYGFHVSATRTAARRQACAADLAGLFGSVTAAKLLVALLLALPLYGVGLAIPHGGDDPWLPALALLAAVAQAQDPMWFFLGTEQPNRIAAATILSRLATLAVLVLFLRGPEDAWIYFAAQAASWSGLLAYGILLVRRQTGFGPRHLRAPGTPLRDGWRFFQLFLGSNVFDALLPIVLGAVSTPQSVGVFVAADKLARAASGLIGPLRTALFPSVTALMAESREAAARLWRWAMLRAGGLAALAGLVMLLGAEPIMRAVLGAAAGEGSAAADMLRLLSPLPLLLTVNITLGVQWMIPSGLEGWLRNLYLASGCLRLALCAALGWQIDALAGAVANLCGELMVLGACLVFLRRRRLCPWSA